VYYSGKPLIPDSYQHLIFSLPFYCHPKFVSGSLPYLFLSLRGLRRSPWQSRICFFFVILNLFQDLCSNQSTKRIKNRDCFVANAPRRDGRVKSLRGLRRSPWQSRISKERSFATAAQGDKKVVFLRNGVTKNLCLNNIQKV
jgi:hypothetical protein